MRNIVKVIEEIKAVIPIDFEVKEDLFERLDWVIKDAACRSPELMYVSWNRLLEVLQKHVKIDDNSWTQEVASIFSGVPSKSNQEGQSNG